MDDEKQITNETTGAVGLVGLILFVVGIGALGYWYFANNQSNNSQITPTPSLVQTPKIPTSDTPTKTPTSTQNPTADWESFEMPKYSISLKRPNHWVESVVPISSLTVSNTSDDVVVGGVIWDGSADYGTDDVRTPLFMLTVIDNSDENLTLKDWIVKYDINFANFGPVKDFDFDIAERETLFIGLDTVYVMYKRNIFRFNMGYTKYSMYPEDKYQQIFEQVLKSVKFN